MFFNRLFLRASRLIWNSLWDFFFKLHSTNFFCFSQKQFFWTADQSYGCRFYPVVYWTKVNQTGLNSLKRTLPVWNRWENWQGLLLFTHSIFIFHFLVSHDALGLWSKCFLTLFLGIPLSITYDLFEVWKLTPRSQFDFVLLLSFPITLEQGMLSFEIILRFLFTFTFSVLPHWSATFLTLLFNTVSSLQSVCFLYNLDTFLSFH